MLKQAENPPVKSPDVVSLDEFVGCWWVAHVKPRQEKALAWELLHSGRSYFLPMYDKTLRSRGRSWNSQVVLFPGYLFLCGQEEDRLAALQGGRVVRMIDVPDQRQLARELAGLVRMLAADVPVGPTAKLKKGQRCRITGGPLAELEGVVEQVRGRCRFVLMVSILGQGAAVEIDGDCIEPL